MKILQINVCCGVGSTGRICTDIAALAEQRGYTCKVAYGRDAVPSVYEKYAVKIGNTLSILVDGAMSRIADRAGFNSSLATRRFMKWVREYDPDIIHLHNLHGYYINIEQLFDYLKETQKPVVWTLHDCWSFTGHCAHFDLIGCDKWKRECGDCPQKREYPASFLWDGSRKNFEKKKNCFTGLDNLTIVTPSQWLSGLVKASFLKSYDTAVIPNGIDRTVFVPTESDFRRKYGCEDKFILLGVSFGWGKKKGLDVFIELAKRLDDRFQIVLVGTDESTDGQLPDNVLSIHKTDSPQELAQIYTAADLLVNPTREDTYPTVNMEALSCGTPVVTFATGGSPEMLDETCGSVVPQNDVDALFNEINRIMRKAPYAKQACLAKAENFDREQRFLEYIHLYEQKTEKGGN